jgi:hypothetical protein
LLWLWPRPAIKLGEGPDVINCAGDDAARAWRIQTLAGTPRCAGAPLGAEARLGPGQWLETDAYSRVEVEVADIGSMVVSPQSRLRLLASGEREHRVELAHGRIEAAVDAPPRLFVVETPAATAVDLGCSYTLEVDAAGAGRLSVSYGYVELARGEVEVFVPAGAECSIRPAIGPGTPYWRSSSARFQQALAAVDGATGDPPAAEVDALLAEARPPDSLSLYHLLLRQQGRTRARIYQRLTAIVAPPPSVHEKQVMAGDHAALSLWRSQLLPMWTQQNQKKKPRNQRPRSQ